MNFEGYVPAGRDWRDFKILALMRENQAVLKVTLSYVTPPTDEQYEKIKQF
ncbi:MAG: hypothetical protein ACLUUJ_04395 [Acutalibacteraceae bacterium]